MFLGELHWYRLMKYLYVKSNEIYQNKKTPSFEEVL